jgi:hypothetical protein
MKLQRTQASVDSEHYTGAKLCRGSATPQKDASDNQDY